MAQLKDTLVSGNLRVTDTILADILQADSIKGGIVATGTTWNGNTIDEIYGGTGQNTYAKGDLLYASAANTLSKLGANTGTKKFLSMTSSVPSWASIASTDLPAMYIGTTKVQFSSAAQALTGITTGAFSSNVTIGGTLTVGTTSANKDTTLNGTLSVKSNVYNLIDVYRTDTNGGAFIKYYAMGQTANYWLAGATQDIHFGFSYGVTGSNTLKLYIDSNANFVPATNTDSTTTQSLGTSSYRWNDLYTRRINASGLSTLSGGITLGGTYNSADSKLVWDASHNAWHLIGNFYADGFVSAGGWNDSSGTSGIDEDGMWLALSKSTTDKIHISHMPYVAGSAFDLTTGTSTNGTIWAAKTIADYVQSQVNTSVTSALYFRGESSTAITNNGTETATINGSSLTAKTGDLVLYNGKEFAWDGTKWIQLGDESSWASKTTKIEGTGYLSGGGTLESNRTIDIGTTYKTKIDNGATAYGYFSNNILPVSHGGTGKSTWTQYGIVYASASGTLAQIALPTWAASTTYWLKAVTNSSKVPTYSLATLSKSDVGLGNVENTALSTWAGTNKITTVGTVTTGTWNATAISAKYGGTGMSGDNAFTGAYRIVYTSSATAMTTLAPNTTSTKKFLTMTGTGSAGQAPTWDTVTKSDVGLGNVANSTYAGGTAVTLNGTSKASSTASFYAPTASGTANQVLVAGGNNTAPSWTNQSNLSVGTASKLGSATVGSATMPIYLNSGTPTAITSFPEAYLSWGGKNFAGSYGPIDAAMVSELGACRTMFAKAAGIVVEYSTDSGSTWLDYGATDPQKVALFSTGNSFVIGKNTTAGGGTSEKMLRVTLRTSAASIYTILNKFVIYISTEGSTGCYCTIRCRTQQNYENNVDTWVIKADHVPIAGYSGYNVINISATATYGNAKASQYGEWQFIFGCTGFATSSTAKGLFVNKIFGFGGVGWTVPSQMARHGHLYSYDSSQNAIFPVNVTANAFIKSGGTSSQFLKADGTVDSNKYVTIDTSQTITGAKTFSANTAITGTLTVGTSSANKATTLNGTLSVTGLSTLAGGAKLTTTKKIWFGDDYYLELDSNGLHTNAGFYSDSFVSAGGLSDGSGTSGIDWDALATNDAIHKIHYSHLPLSVSDGTTETGKYVSGISYSGGVFTVSKASLPSAYSLPVATSDALGGIKIGYTTSGKNYAVVLDANNRAYVNVPWSNTDTWRGIYTGGTSRIGTGTGTKAINFVAGSNVTISYEAAGTGSGQSGNANYFNVKIAATDTTYSSQAAASGGTAVSLVTTGEKYNWNTAYNSLGDYVLKSGDTMTGTLYTNESFIVNSHALDAVSPTAQHIVINGYNDSSSVGYCPGIGFHIPGVTWGTLKLGRDGVFAFYDNSLTSYFGVRASAFYKAGGTSSQFLKADGSVDSTSYLPLTGGTMKNTNVVTNLNADLLDGKNYSDFGYAIYGGDLDCNEVGTHFASYRFDASPTNAFYGAGYGNMLVIGGTGTDTMTQLGGPYHSQELYFRNGTWYSDGTGSIRTAAWNRIWHSGNFTPSDYLPLSAGSSNPLTNDLYITGGNGRVVLNGVVQYNYNNTVKLLGPYSQDLSWYDGSAWTKVWHSGNDGSSSGLDADLLDGYHASTSNTPWGTIPVLTSGGFMDVGKHFEFHYDNTTGSDYSTILQCTGNYSNIVSLPSGTGTLALTTDNVASATQLQTPRSLWGNSFNGTADINGTMTITPYGGVNILGGYLNLRYSSSQDTLYAGMKYDTNGTEALILSTGYSPAAMLFCPGVNLGTATKDSNYVMKLVPGEIIMAGNVGIGTDSPAYKLDVSGVVSALCMKLGGYSSHIAAAGWYRFYTAASLNNYGNSVILHINRSYYYNDNESYTIAVNIAYNGGISVTQLNGYANWQLITKVRVDYTNQGALYVDFYSAAPAGDGNLVYVTCEGIGSVQAPTAVSSPTGSTKEYALISNGLATSGNIVATGAITAGAASDTRLKTNIQTLSTDSAKGIILKARPVNFTWKDIATELYDGYKGDDIGLIAQEVEELLPQAIGTIFEKYKRLDYTKFIPPIITVIQDHEKRIKELEDIIAKLTEENKHLKEQL